MGSDGELIDAAHYVFPPDPGERDKFTQRPQEVVLVATLEISVRDSSGAYLLVTNPRYDKVENGGIEDFPSESSQWAVPYVTHRVHGKKHSRGWKTIGGILAGIEEAKAVWDPADILGNLVDTWAVGLTDLKLHGQFTEYKRSWSSPTVPKVYHVMRFVAKSNECEHGALADAESRQAFSYLPLEDERYDLTISKRECPRHLRDEYLFLSRPLASNLSTVLNQEHERRKLRDRAIELEETDFFRDETGFLVAGDIAGYGTACEYADKMSTIDFDGDKTAARLRRSATEAFMRMFHEAGVWQIHTAGDGFIAGLPIEPHVDGAAALERFLRSYLGLVRLLDRTRGFIDEHKRKNKSRRAHGMLGSRLAIHHGSYSYGKMAQAASLTSAFDGQAITLVSRLEQGLRTMTKDPAGSDGGKLLDGTLHSAIASDEAVQAWGGLAARSTMLAKLGKAPAQSKEFKRKANLFEVQPGDNGAGR